MPYTHRTLRGVLRFAAAIAVAAALFTGSASAQQTSDDGFSLGLASGFVRGEATRFNPSRLGYYVQTSLEFPSPVPALRVRADGIFADWDSGDMSALTANLLLSPMPGKRIVPYALVGAGGFVSNGAKPKAGWGLGVGLRLTGEARTITIETRIHTFIRATPRPVGESENRWQPVFTPIGIGIQF